MIPLPQLTFSACAEAVAGFLNRACSRLDIAVCWFTHPELFRCLMDRAKAGVAIRLVLDFDQINFQPGGLNFSALETAGAQVYGFCGPGLLHHKFALADESRFLTGSFNWTRSEHHDHLLEMDCAPAAAAYSAAFENLLLLCEPLHQLKEKAARAISFQQLHRPLFPSPLEFRRQLIAGARIWVCAFTAAEKEIWHRCLYEQRHYFRCRNHLHAFWKGHFHWDKSRFEDWLSTYAASAALKKAAHYCLRLKPGDLLVAVQPPDTMLGLGLIGSDPEGVVLPNYGASRYVAWLPWPKGLAAPESSLVRSRSLFRRYQGSGLQVVDQLIRHEHSAQ